MRRSFRKLGLPLVSMLVLAGCGGGGSDDEPSLPPAAAAPSYSLSYPSLSAYYEMRSAIADTPVSTNAGTLSNFTVTPNLPGGLFLDPSTGTISGTPVGEWMPEDFTISGTRTDGTVVSGKVTFGVHQVGQTAVDPTSTTPRNFTYSTVDVNAYAYEQITPLTPAFQGDIQGYFIGTTPLPYGLSIDSTTGVISGAVGATGDSQVEIRTSPSFYSSDSYSTVIRFHVQTPPMVNAHYVPSSVTIARNDYLALGITFDRGGGTSYTITPALPSGLTFNTSNGSITGSVSSNLPATQYTITATNSVNTVSTTLTLEIADRAPEGLTYTKTSPRYVKNVAIAMNSPSVAYSGGTPTSYSVSPALPTGLSFNTTTGAITGTPTTLSSAATYTVTATNATGSTTFALSLAVVNPGTTTLYTADGMVLKAYSVDDVNGDETDLGHSAATTVTSRLVFHPTHDCVSGYSGSTVESFSIDKSQQGALTNVSKIGGVSSPAAIVQSVSGDYIFVANNGFISSFSIDSSCTLTHIADVAASSGVKEMVISGANIYELNSGAGIQHFRHDGAGGLTLSDSAAMVAHANPPSVSQALGNGLSLAVSTNGQFVYAIDTLKAIETFSVNGSTGALTLSGTAVHNDRFYFRRGWMVGDFLIQPFQAQNDGIASLKMSSGQLDVASLREGSSEVGTNFAGATAVGVHTSPSGTYVYADYSNFARSGSSRLKLDLTTGALTANGVGLSGVVGGY